MARGPVARWNWLVRKPHVAGPFLTIDRVGVEQPVAAV